jgi:hypothetical protein
MVMKGSFSMDGTTPASHIGPLYLALLALLYRVVGHRPAWVPLSQHGIGCDYGILSVSRGRVSSSGYDWRDRRGGDVPQPMPIRCRALAGKPHQVLCEASLKQIRNMLNFQLKLAALHST